MQKKMRSIAIDSLCARGYSKNEAEKLLSEITTRKQATKISNTINLKAYSFAKEQRTINIYV